MYERLPTKEEANAAGFEPEDYASDPVEPFPENERALDLLRYMSTQWRMGPSGPTGLDYTVMHHRMDRMKLSGEEFDELENDRRIMERAALECIHAKS